MNQRTLSNRKQIWLRRADPLHRLPHQRRAQMHAHSDLGGKDVEAFESESTRGALLRHWKRRSDCEVIPGVRGCGLVDDPETTFELLELTAHPVEATQERRVIA